MRAVRGGLAYVPVPMQSPGWGEAPRCSRSQTSLCGWGLSGALAIDQCGPNLRTKPDAGGARVGPAPHQRPAWAGGLQDDRAMRVDQVVDLVIDLVWNALLVQQERSDDASEFGAVVFFESQTGGF